ncbi:MAG TPA: thiosulfohydrolase SoxB [Paracoccaceae bacterium]|nr:thiosulfohydrolase SoxB [Paracoccaceae bacterium]
MITRRAFWQAGLATAAILGAGGWSRAMAQQALSQDQLLAFPDFGNVTLIHVTDLHAQAYPVWFREPDTNIGVGAARGVVPHLTGAELRAAYGIAPGTAEAHALSHEDFAALAKAYGRMGGIDRVATLVRAIRAARPGAILLDGGDTWHGSLPALRTAGQDMVEIMNALGTDAMTSHWEWTLGADRVAEIVAGLPFAFLGQNIFDAEWDEPLHEPYTVFERGGARVAVIGQAFPYTAIANPRWMFENVSFGLRLERLQALVDELRAEGVDGVVVLSHNGFDVDRQMAATVRGIDVVLTGHTHDALPEPVMVGQTLLLASGSNGKFVARLDLDLREGRMMGFRHRLIPVFSDVIASDPDMAALVKDLHAPFRAEMDEVLATTETLLYRRGNFNGTWDDLICDAIRAGRDVQVALSPGVRWGPSILPGEPVTRGDLMNATAMSYGQCYRMEMTGAQLRAILEDVADNIFHPDPFYQQGGDMVRVGGLSYHIDVGAPMGARISGLRLEGGAELEDGRAYTVGGWASVNEGVEGPQIWDVIEAHLKRIGTVRLEPRDTVTVTGA